MEVIWQPLYGILKHNESDESLAHLLRSFVGEDNRLLFSFYERNMHLYDETMQKNIYDQSVFTNSQWVLPWEPSIVFEDEDNVLPTIIWYEATSIEQIMKAITINPLFTCVVVESGKSFHQFSNVLFHQEYYPTIDEQEDYENCLCFTDKQSFLQQVAPRFSIRIID